MHGRKFPTGTGVSTYQRSRAETKVTIVQTRIVATSSDDMWILTCYDQKADLRYQKRTTCHTGVTKRTAMLPVVADIVRSQKHDLTDWSEGTGNDQMRHATLLDLVQRPGKTCVSLTSCVKEKGSSPIESSTPAKRSIASERRGAPG